MNQNIQDLISKIKLKELELERIYRIDPGYLFISQRAYDQILEELDLAALDTLLGFTLIVVEEDDENYRGDWGFKLATENPKKGKS